MLNGKVYPREIEREDVGERMETEDEREERKEARRKGTRRDDVRRM